MQGKMLSKQMESRTRNIMVKRRKSGYLQKFKYNVCCNNYGVSGELIKWCEEKCRGNWGWWFDTAPEWHSHWNPENNLAYMSFSHGRDAFRFWFENLKILEENRN